MDTTDAPTPVQVCPQCGAHFPSPAVWCWLCGWKTGDPVFVRPERKTGSADNPYAAPAPSADDLARTYSLSTLFLWTTLVACVMGVVRIAPGLGIVLAVLSLPAALRTVGRVGRLRTKTGRAMTVSGKISTFMSSLTICFVIALGASTAFTLTCFPIGLLGFSSGGGGGGVLILAVIAGLIAGGFAGYWLIRWLWRQRY
jgi:hypothetical protein